jgi:hypothetical protein
MDGRYCQMCKQDTDGWMVRLAQVDMNVHDPRFIHMKGKHHRPGQD